MIEKTVETDLNSNIEIHKSIISQLTLKYLLHLNSNIEIHKFTSENKNMEVLQKFKF